MNAAIFHAGKTWPAYLNSIQKNCEKFKSVHDTFVASADDLETFRSAGVRRILAIAEDWCPDVFNMLGIVAKIAEAIPEIELRIFERDSRPDVMDQYLSNGKRRIPAFAFFDADFHELCRWAGRNKAADEWVMAFRKGRPYDQIPQGEREAFREELSRRYAESYARGNLEEIKELLRGALVSSR